MERSFFKLDSYGENAPRGRFYGFSLSILTANAALFAVCALFGSYSPFEGIAPFGPAGTMAAWFSGADPYFAAAGAALGCALSGNFTEAGVCLAMGAAVFLLRRRQIMRVYRLLILFGIQLALTAVIGALAGRRLLLLAAGSTVSVFAAVVMGGGFRALSAIRSSRSLTDTELLTLSALAGLITLSMRSFGLFGVSAAMVFAGVSGLIAAYRCGISAVAFAVTAGAGRVLASGCDVKFIAVISASVLLAASVRSMGKWSSLVGFGLSSAALTGSFTGTGLFSYAEIGVILFVFALIPKRLYSPLSAERESDRSSSDPRLARLQYRVASLSDVLSELARVCGERDGQMLRCIAGTLRRSLNNSCRPSPAFTAEYGSASVKKPGSPRSGDSLTLCETDGKLLIALSDGMGSGNEASDESRAALALLKDLLTVGFTIDDAAACVNRLLAECGGGDMYATLDVMLIDLEDGTARLSKHGAPSSYVLRNGRVFTLYSEALPIGIIENAQGTARSLRLKSGDVIIMMTDGLSDALESGLIAALTDELSDFDDAEEAAEAIMRKAAESGFDDDMTVTVARLEGRA